MKTTTLLIVLTFIAMTNSYAGILAGPIVNPENGHTYYLLTEDTWQNSETQAVVLGGHLATINNQAEQDWVFASFGSFGGTNRSLWIGLSDAAQEGTFVWASGEPVTYTQWHPGQPDNAVGGEHYVHMMPQPVGPETAGFWNDFANAVSNRPDLQPVCGVVEIVVPPLNLLTNGLVAYYPFNGNANDESGRGLHCDSTNVQPAMNRFGNLSGALQLDGDNSVIIQPTPAFNVGQTQYTVTLWMATDDASKLYQGLFNTIPHNGMLLVLNHPPTIGRVASIIGPGSSGWITGFNGGAKNDYVSGTWYQVVFVKDGVNYSCYVNGQLDHNLDLPAASSFDQLSGWHIGGWGNTFTTSAGGFQGRLDDIRIYDRALASNEVAQLYAIESAPPLNQYPPINGLVLEAVIDPRAYGLATSEFSDALAMSGDRIVVQQAFGGGSGALSPANSGLVHVFGRTASNSYSLATTITTPHTVFDAPAFGISVGIVNQLVYVGSHHTFRAGAHDGTAYLYSLNPNANLLEAWTEFPSQWAGYFGGAGRMISDALVISQGSASAYGSRAGVFFYRVDGNGARQQVFSLMAPDTDRNVRAIALSTNRCAVRWDSRANTGNNEFLVFDIQRTSSNTIASVSTNCVITRFAEGSPESLACDDQWVAIGDPTAVSGGSECGAVYLYRITSGAANLAATIYPPDLYNGGGFGQAVCLANGFLLVGSPSAPGSAGTNGCVYVFSLTSGGGATLLTRLQPAAVIGSSESFGSPIVSDGNRVAIGSSDQFQAGNGAVYVYTLEAPPCIPHPATATATVVNGSVVGIQLTDLGCGYTNAPIVRIVGGGGTGATAMTTITNGYVTSITIIDGGTGYTNAPRVRVASPPFVPSLSIAVSRVKVTLHLLLGHNYVLESSSDLQNWMQVGAQFTAEDEVIEQEFEIGLTGRFFRTREVP